MGVREARPTRPAQGRHRPSAPSRRKAALPTHSGGGLSLAERSPYRTSGLTPVVYVYVNPEGTVAKIGTTDNLVKRDKQYATHGEFELYVAIRGTATDEANVHRHFADYRIDNGRGAEKFRLEGELREWVEWLGTRAFAATSIEDVANTYPVGHCWPWSNWRDSAYADGQMRLDDLGPQLRPALRKPLSRSNRIRATIRSDSDEWYTPPLYIEAARRVMGGIDLDPASCALANTVVQADEIFTVNEDGLQKPWKGRVWLNPPYGNLKDKFVDHLLLDYSDGRVEQAVLCLNAHAVDTVWFQPLWRHPVCLTHHRVRFFGGQQNKDVDDQAPTTGTAFVYVGLNEDAFAEEFSLFGPVLGWQKRLARTTSEEFRREYQQTGRDWEMPA